MLQRKQTIYFFLAGIVSVILIISPLALLKFNGQAYLFTVSGIKSVSPGTILGVSTLPLLILISIIAGINFIAIFFFKKRQFQMKLCVLNLVFILGLSALIIFHLVSISTSEIAYSWGLPLPVVILILIILAYMGVRKDEKLVKSLDRIR
jgi:hypothetical protein